MRSCPPSSVAAEIRSNFDRNPKQSVFFLGFFAILHLDSIFYFIVIFARNLIIVYFVFATLGCVTRTPSYSSRTPLLRPASLPAWSGSRAVHGGLSATNARRTRRSVSGRQIF